MKPGLLVPEHQRQGPSVHRKAQWRSMDLSSKPRGPTPATPSRKRSSRASGTPLKKSLRSQTKLQDDIPEIRQHVIPQRLIGSGMGGNEGNFDGKIGNFW